MLYTADGVGEIDNGSLPELPVGLNFGPGGAKPEFALLEKKRPNVPHFCSEWWDGWFDHWGDKHHTSNAGKEADELKWMLEQGYSVNLYMFHGGTSFGWMAGANIDHGNYEPTVTSYDYDVPVSESGELRPKYFVFRDIIRKATGITPPEPPAAIQTALPQPIQMNGAAAVWDTLPEATQSEKILSMEDVGRSYGYILYRTTIEKPQTGELKVQDVHSYAQVYVDGVLAGTLDRRLNQKALTITSTHANARLDILVENSGRVNFGPAIPHERAGITKQASLGGEVLKGWSIFPLPMDGVSGLAYQAAGCEGACFYRGTFKADAQADTFLDTRELGKGVVFLNGKALGRFWKIGPQGTLYVPGPWLRKGENEIVVFDLEGKGAAGLGFVGQAVLDSKRE
jgi:beta-galactosidase